MSSKGQDSKPSPAPQTTVQGKPGEPAPSPTSLSAEQVEEVISKRIAEQSQRQMEATERLVAGMGEQLAQAIGLSRQPPPETKKKASLPTKEEIRAAAKKMADDDDPEALFEVIGKTVAASNEELEARFDEKFRALANYGITQFEEVNSTLGQGKLPYWEKYAKEIQAELSTVSADQRATFKIRKAAHDLVVGRHLVAGDLKAELLAEAQTEEDDETTSTGQVGRSGRKTIPQTTSDDLYPDAEPPSKAAIAHMRGALGHRAEGLKGIEIANAYAKEVLKYEDPSGEGQHWAYYQTPSAHGGRFRKLLGLADS